MTKLKTHLTHSHLQAIQHQCDRVIINVCMSVDELYENGRTQRKNSHGYLKRGTGQIITYMSRNKMTPIWIILPSSGLFKLFKYNNGASLWLDWSLWVIAGSSLRWLFIFRGYRVRNRQIMCTKE